jgi:hypothetical protein
MMESKDAKFGIAASARDFEWDLEPGAILFKQWIERH